MVRIGREVGRWRGGYMARAVAAHHAPRMHSAAFRLLLFAVFCLFADPPELDCALSSADLVREPPLESSVDLTDCVSVKHMLAAAPLEKSSWVVC